MKKIMTLMINFTKKNMKIKFVDFKEIMELHSLLFSSKVSKHHFKWLNIEDLFVQQIICAEDNMDQQELKFLVHN